MSFERSLLWFILASGAGIVSSAAAADRFLNAGFWSTYDPGAHGVGTDPDGFIGAVFDGRYIYFAPGYNGSGASGEVLRYDTTGGFGSATSWDAYDPAAHGVGTNPRGYYGGAFDGRYVYFAPVHNGSEKHGEVLRYDTLAGFASATSWAAYDPGANGVGADPDGFNGAVFDGRYVYFVPNHNGTEMNGEVLRYDTQGAFSNASSWSTYDPGANGVGTDPDGFAGAVFDGRYIYFVPYNNNPGSLYGEVLRYDTHAAFDTSSSWATYNYDTDPGGCATQQSRLGHPCIHPRGFLGAAFDGRPLDNPPVAGRYIYFAPQKVSNVDSSGEVLRFDTNGDFENASSWVSYDYSADANGCAAQQSRLGVACTHAEGYTGAVVVGRYVYFAPYGYDGDVEFGEVLRYDTSGNFLSPTSWATYDAGDHGVGSDPDGFEDAVSDGRYVYFVPHHNGTEYHGEVLRFDTNVDIPTVSTWGLLAMALLTVAAGTIVVMRRRRVANA